MASDAHSTIVPRRTSTSLFGALARFQHLRAYDVADVLPRDFGPFEEFVRSGTNCAFLSRQTHVPAQEIKP